MYVHFSARDDSLFCIHALYVCSRLKELALFSHSQLVAGIVAHILRIALLTSFSCCIWPVFLRFWRVSERNKKQYVLLSLTYPSDTSDQLAAYLRKNQISQRSSKTSRCHLFLVASLVLSDAALDCHQYSQVLELAKSLQFYKQCGIVKKVHIGFS